MKPQPPQVHVQVRARGDAITAAIKARPELNSLPMNQWPKDILDSLPAHPLERRRK